MKTIYADYNAATEAGHICLTTRGSRADLERTGDRPGDWVGLIDSEVVLAARLAIDDYYGLVGIPDCDTLIHLDDDDVRDLDAVETELERLRQKPRLSRDEENRLLQLLSAYEALSAKAGDGEMALPPADRAMLRAATLDSLGKPELALLEMEEARRLGSADPDVEFLRLGLLRRLDLPRARREAESLAADPESPAEILVECINVLATHADGLPDDRFPDVADRILEWSDRFDRAPGRERVTALTLSLLQFNRGMALLRLGRGDAARDALRLARAVDPVFSEIGEATSLTAYDQQARDLAARVRGRSTAA